MQVAQETEQRNRESVHLGRTEERETRMMQRLHHECHTARFPQFTCETGEVILDLAIAYETWGKLSPTRDNVIVVCHALTGDAHAGPSDVPPSVSDGWWQGLIGPGKALDTDRYFVLCSNVIGGCSGSTGPATKGPDGQPYGLRFPLVSIRDIVNAQVALLDTLEIPSVEMVIGGSLGGMQVWEWLLLGGERIKSGMVIAAHAAFTPLAIGYNAAMRRAITSDPGWQDGNYYQTKQKPVNGLALARTIGMLTYRASGLYDAKFERRQVGEKSVEPEPITGKNAFTAPEYEVESYLDYNGDKFVRRFDANTYLYLTKAMDGHDIGRGRGGMDSALAAISCKTTVVGINSDYLYDPGDLRRTAERAKCLGAPVVYEELNSPHGHDAFLIEYESLGELVKSHLHWGRS